MRQDGSTIKSSASLRLRRPEREHCHHKSINDDAHQRSLVQNALNARSLCVRGSFVRSIGLQFCLPLQPSLKESVAIP